jgi:hypothetical protein
MAADTYDQAALLVYGKKAILNNPENEFNYPVSSKYSNEQIRHALEEIRSEAKRHIQLTRRKPSGRTSNYFGVQFSKQKKIWQALLTQDRRKPIYLGQFNDEGQAARIHDLVARTIIAKGARLNFPNEYNSIDFNKLRKIYKTNGIKGLLYHLRESEIGTP